MAHVLYAIHQEILFSEREDFLAVDFYSHLQIKMLDNLEEKQF